MKITKKLKYAEFSYDESDKTFAITEEDGNRVILNKVYSFAFMRFVIRIAQRNFLRTKKILDTPPPSMVDLPSLEHESIEDLQQSLLFADEELENK